MSTYFTFPAYDVDRYSEDFIFVSYKSEDNEIVGPYARHLHENDINVWYDDGINPGEDWANYIIEVLGLPNCKAVCFFASANVEKSTVIPIELKKAWNRGIPIICIYLHPGISLSTLLKNKMLSEYINGYQSVYAYGKPIDEINNEILTAAQTALSHRITKPDSDDRCGALVADAYVWLNHFKTSKDHSDLEKALSRFTKITEEFSSDYRGWMGLIECTPNTTDSYSTKLANIDEYWSYIRSCNSEFVCTDRYQHVVKTILTDQLQAIVLKFSHQQDNDYITRENKVSCAISDIEKLLLQQEMNLAFCSDIKADAQKLLDNYRIELNELTPKANQERIQRKAIAQVEKRKYLIRRLINSAWYVILVLLTLSSSLYSFFFYNIVGGNSTTNLSAAVPVVWIAICTLLFGGLTARHLRDKKTLLCYLGVFALSNTIFTLIASTHINGIPTSLVCLYCVFIPAGFWFISSISLDDSLSSITSIFICIFLFAAAAFAYGLVFLLRNNSGGILSINALLCVFVLPALMFSNASEFSKG